MRFGHAAVFGDAFPFKQMQREVVVCPGIAALGRLLQQRGGARRVRWHSPAAVAQQRQRDLRIGVALRRRAPVPPGGGLRVGVHAGPVFMDDAETEFGVGMAALGGERIPSPRLGEVAVNADAARVEKPELRLGVDEVLFGRFPTPSKSLFRLRLDRKAIRKDQLAIALGEILVDRRRRLIPLRDPAARAAMQIDEAQLILRLRMPLFGRPPQPDDAIAGAGDDSFATQINQTQPIGSLGLAGGGGPPEAPECLGEIAPGAGAHPAAHGPARLAGDGRRSRHGSRMASLNVRTAPLTR